MQLSDLLSEMDALAHPQVARQQMRFFRTGPGQYGEGDRFMGIKVPVLRALAKKYRLLPLAQVGDLLASPWHEARLMGLLIAMHQYRKGKEAEQRQIFEFLLAHLAAFNNWDLVDVIVPSTLGDYLYQHPSERPRLDAWLTSGSLWERRIALLCSLAFIRKGDTALTWRLCAGVLNDAHDLIHKASGWMLREAGHRDPLGLLGFLEDHAAVMPRTMLRYAIEKLSPEQKKDYMGRRGRAPRAASREQKRQGS